MRLLSSSVESISSRCGGREPLELWLFGVAYAVFSSTLLVANKWALSWIPAPNFLMTLQCIATALVVYAVSSINQKRLSIKLDNPFVTRQSAIWFIVCVLVQFATIGSNMMSLHLLGVDRVILLRIFAMFPIAIGDWLFNNRHLPSFNAWSCFACLGAAVLFVFGFASSASLQFSSIMWGLIYFVSITTDQVLLKRFTKAIPMEDANRTFWMNILGAPVSGVGIFVFGELPTMRSAESHPNLYISIVLSCILGAGISYTAWGLRRRSSALTFSLVGIICKLGSMGLNFLFLEHLSLDSLLIIALSIVSTFFYEQAPERTKPKQPASFSPVPTDGEEENGDGLEPQTEELQELTTKKSEISEVDATIQLDEEDGPDAPQDLEHVPWQLNFSRKSYFVIAIFLAIIAAGIFHTVSVTRSAALPPAAAAFPPSETTLESACSAPTSSSSTNLPPIMPFPTPSDTPDPHSWHRCVGETAGATFWRYKSCHFKNVCYDGNNDGTLVYFADRFDDVAASDLSSPSMVTYTDDPRAIPIEYKLSIVQGAINSSNAIWPHGKDNNNVVTILSNYFIPAVWTHLVFDNILPMFRVLEMFGMPKTVVEPLWFDYPCKTSYQSGCSFSEPQYNPEWWRIITAGSFDVSKIQDRYRFLAISQQKLVCFRHVMTGLSLLTDHGLGTSGHGRDLSKPDWTNWGTSDMFWRYRLLTMERFGLLEPEKIVPKEDDGFYDVVFLRKGSRSYGNNALDVSPAVAALNTTLLGLNMTHIRVAPAIYLDRYSARDQLNLMARTKVVVAQVGSTAYGGFWLPRGGSLVMLEVGEKLDFFFWHQLGHINTKFIRWNALNTEPIVRAVLAGLSRYEHGSHV